MCCLKSEYSLPAKLNTLSAEAAAKELTCHASNMREVFLMRRPPLQGVNVNVDRQLEVPIDLGLLGSGCSYHRHQALMAP